MNIQKSRFAAMLTVMLMVCMMVTMLVVPASAAEIEQTFNSVYVQDVSAWKAILYINGAEEDCIEAIDETFFNEKFPDGVHGYLSDDETTFVITDSELQDALYALDELCETSHPWNWTPTEYYVDGSDAYYYIIPIETLLFDFDESEPITLTFYSESSGPELVERPGISSVVTKEMLSGVLDEVVALLPVVIPVMIGFIGLRKGISFLQSVLHSA